MTMKLSLGVGVGVVAAIGIFIGAYVNAERQSKPMTVSELSVIYEIKKIVKNMIVQNRISENSDLTIENARTIDELSQGSTDTLRMKEGLRRGWKYKVKYRNSSAFQILVVNGSTDTCINQDGFSCE